MAYSNEENTRGNKGTIYKDTSRARAIEPLSPLGGGRIRGGDSRQNQTGETRGEKAPLKGAVTFSQGYSWPQVTARKVSRKQVPRLHSSLSLLQSLAM